MVNQPLQGNPSESVTDEPAVQPHYEQKNPNRTMKIAIIFILLSTLAAFLIGGFMLGSKNNVEPKACTQEAKLCPDGSYVSRTGPNCEFATCPVSLNTTDYIENSIIEKWCLAKDPSLNPVYKCDTGEYRIPPYSPGMGVRYLDSKGDEITFCGGSVLNNKEDSRCEYLQKLNCTNKNICENKEETNSSNPTANWKIYTNKNFSFKYPPTWKSDTIDPKLTEDIVRFVFSENNEEYKFIVASGGSGGPIADKIENQSLELNGKKFIKRTWINAGKPFFISLMPDGENSFNSFNHVEISLPPKNFDKYVAIFDQILQTFKFIN